MEDRTKAARNPRESQPLTVRDIRGLLTRLGHDLARSLASPPPSAAEAQAVEPRRFVESMEPHVRMN